MKYSHVSFSDTGQKRSINEDAIGVYEIEDGFLAVVCDGLGGNKAGEVASGLTVNKVHSLFIESKELDYLERIKKAITGANKAVLEQSNSNEDLSGMATTVEVVYLKNNTVFWGHVGDSRIYIYRNNKLKQLTKDHSLIQKLVDEGHLTLNEAENHPNKNIIMRALGDDPELEVDLSKLKVTDSDKIKFFICTDGVTAVLNDEEIEKILKDSKLNKIATKLSKVIEERGAPDNYSFVIVEKN